MEFRFRANDDRLFSQNPSHSSDISPDQALQVSYPDFKNLLPGGRSMEELQKELLEEKIRGEIIAQRIMQKRMLEEEAQRNFELSNKMFKSTTEDRQSSLPVNNIAANIAQRQSSSPVIEEIKEMPMEIDTPDMDDLVCQKRKFNTASEETREVKHQKIMAELGCALCHFSATTEDEFKEHLKDQSHVDNLGKRSNGGRKAAEHSTLNEKASPVQETKEVTASKKTKETKEKGLDGGELNCTICGISVTSKSALMEHVKGKKHLAKAAKFNPSNNGNDSSSNGKAIQVAPKEAVKEKDFYCTLCNINCHSEGVLDSHFKGKKHLVMAQKMSVAPTINLTEKSSNEPEKHAASENTDLSCILCDVRVTCKLALEEHRRGKKHLANVMKRSITDQTEKGNGSDNSSSFKGKAVNIPPIDEDMKNGEIQDAAHEEFLAAEHMVSDL